ncbi:FecR family protein [Dawidia soli]|uniref:FecR domain-containing protein n=1 Tax=Dawidia soli TaxID=2782352 RepID=A0AAP2D9J4_9BACT|nr:FecR domain-containing protein [Dawidia soli]MBT1686845.1 FecR domain-containing protein [Dawidia soli]
MNTDHEDLEFEKKIREMKIPLANFISEEEKETSWKEILLQVEKPSSGRPAITPVRWLAAAAVLFILGLSLTLIVRLDKVFKTDDHEKLNVSLADGSNVTLNRQTRLTLSGGFGEKNRKVSLEGEAFFNIRRDESSPFVIGVGGYEVMVGGTSFNVSFRNQVTEVTVRSGIVRLRSGTNSLNLKAGEKGRISPTGGLSVLPWDLNDFSWYSGSLTLKEKSLKEVAVMLSKLFDRKVEVDAAIASCTLSAKIEYETLEDILNIINETLGTKWRTDSNTLYIYGKGC